MALGVRLPEQNQVTLTGRLTRDPEVMVTQSGVTKCWFSLAVNRRFKDGTGEWRDDVTFVPVTVWREAAERCRERLKKGSPIYVEGRLQTRSYDKDGQKLYSTEVIATDVILLGGKGESDNSPTSQPRSASQARAPQSAPSSEMIMDDDVPF